MSTVIMAGSFPSFPSMGDHYVCHYMVKMNYCTLSDQVQHDWQVIMYLLTTRVHYETRKVACGNTVSICTWHAHTDPHDQLTKCTVASHANLHLFGGKQYLNDNDIKNSFHEDNFQRGRKLKKHFLCLFHIPCNGTPFKNTAVNWRSELP
jgi:hypothetical protein